MGSIDGDSVLRRALIGIGAAAVALGMLGLAPATAQAETASTTAGATAPSRLVVTVKGSVSKTKAFERGWLTVTDVSCTKSPSEVIANLKTSRNRVTVTLKKAGTYRLLYTGYPKKHRYGVGSANTCLTAPKVKVGAGKTARRTLTAKPGGKLHVTGYKLKTRQGIAVYSGRTGKFLAWISYPSRNSKERAIGYGQAGLEFGEPGSEALAQAAAAARSFSYRSRGSDQSPLPGTYRVAKVSAKYNAKRGEWTPRKKTLRSGRLITIRADRAVSFDLAKNRIQTLREQPLRARTSISGLVRVYKAAGSYTMAKPGARLKARTTGFKRGTKFSYKWQVDGRTVSTKSYYTPKAGDDGKWLNLRIVGKKKGTFTFENHGQDYASVGLWKVYETMPLKLNGSGSEVFGHWSAANGEMLGVTDAQLWESPVTPSYKWTTDGGATVLSTGNSLTASNALNGKTVTLTAIYSVKGYRPHVVTRSFTVAVV